MAPMEKRRRGMELSRSLIIGAVSCLILSVALVVSVAQVPSPLNVDRFDDDASATACTDAPNDCSLRGAIITANARPGADTINLPAGPYRLSISPGGEDTAATGDLDITDSLTIVGAGATVTTIAWLDGPDIVPDRVFHIVSPGITVTISGVTIRNGQANSDGGGILNNATLTLAESVVSDNETSFGYGGGIFSGGANGVASSLSLTNSTVRNNTAPDGGGIFNNGTATLTGSAVSENEALLGEGGYGGYGGYGGGILNGGVDAFDLSDGVFQSTLTLTNSTVNGNMAGSGGGIFNGGGYGGFENNLTLTNTTISGNSADNDGGGIFNNNTTNLNNVTVTNNAADSDNNAVGRGGGIFNGERPGEEFSAGVVNFKNTIIAIDTANRGQGPDCFAPSSSPLISQNYNLIQNTANCVIGGDTSNNITGQSPNLGPLADNGGPTLTHALLVDSPAIDAGNPAGCTDNVGNVLTTDQRGAARPTDGNGDGVAICDIGSYERMAIPADLSITKGDTSDPVDAGEDLTYILTVTNNGPATATGVKVTDTLPAGVRLAISATPSQGSCVASCQLTCELGTISSGGSATVTIIVRPTRPGTFVNVATVSGVQFDPNLGNNETPGIETVVTLPQPATASREIPAVSDFADPLLAYVLIGSPLNLANPDPLTVLQPVLGRPGPGLWRMFRFNPIPAPGKYLEFSAGDPFFNFSQGHGAWLISRDRVTVMMSGDPNDASRRFDIPLQPGRNQIATPFNFSPNFILDWNGCVVPRLQELEIPISPVLVGYEGSEGGYIMTKE